VSLQLLLSRHHTRDLFDVISFLLQFDNLHIMFGRVIGVVCCVSRSKRVWCCAVGTEHRVDRLVSRRPRICVSWGPAAEFYTRA